MDNNFLIICIGNNSNNLNGCENDAILFYNLNFLYPKHLLLGKNATLKNLNKIFQLNNKKTNIIIFFSGHGFKGGCLNLYDGILKPIEIYDSINSNFNDYVDLYLILDCCYSGGFPQIKNFNKIKNTYIIASCQENEKSSEIIIFYNSNYFPSWKPTYNNKKIVLGLFTVNLVEIIRKHNLYDIKKWLDKNEYWEELENISFQKIVIKQ
jgi:hypothetical protein